MTNILLRNFYLLLCIWISFSCITEDNELLEKEEIIIASTHDDDKDSISRTRSTSFLENPALEWWHYEQGNLAMPNIYDIYVSNQPFSPLTNDTCKNYISIILDCYPPYYRFGAVNYNKIQIQIKNPTSMTWYYPKFNNNPIPPLPGISKKKEYGITDRLIDYGGFIDQPQDYNSVSFPAGYMDIRLRVLHKDFPGPNIGDETHPLYDKSLATEWAYFEQNPLNNIYGYNITQPIYNPGTNKWENVIDKDQNILNVQVFFPLIPPENVTYSYTISTGIHDINGVLNHMNEGNHNFSRPNKDYGIIYVFAVRKYERIGQSPEIRYTNKSLFYSPSDTYKYINFSDNDFF